MLVSQPSRRRSLHDYCPCAALILHILMPCTNVGVVHAALCMACPAGTTCPANLMMYPPSPWASHPMQALCALTQALACRMKHKRRCGCKQGPQYCAVKECFCHARRPSFCLHLGLAAMSPQHKFPESACLLAYDCYMQAGEDIDAACSFFRELCPCRKPANVAEFIHYRVKGCEPATACTLSHTGVCPR
jgi:hypothetical protein